MPAPDGLAVARRRPLDELERAIDYSFLDMALLERAMRHGSAAEGKPGEDNRRLAFLGDAVIELAMREEVYNAQPLAERGKLSEDTDKHVQDKDLAQRARALGLQDWLAVGRGEAKNDFGEERRLADAFEALAGAIYLDAKAHAFPVIRRMMGRADATGR
jgi:ribonuclease-3